MIKKLDMLERFISNRFSTNLYVQLWEHRIKVTDTKTGEIFDEKPLIALEITDKGKTVIAIGHRASMTAGDNIEVINPFSHPRALLADFALDEKILQNIIKILHHKKPLAASLLLSTQWRKLKVASR